MPTENRSSNTEMVSVPRELLERCDFGKNTATALAALPELRAILAQPLQHQGEPVAPRLTNPPYKVTPCRFGGKDGYFQVGDALVYDNEAEAVAAAEKKNADLARRYYDALEHTDPGEVERLRNCLRTEIEAGDSWKKEAEELRAENEAFDAGMRNLACQLSAGGYNAETLTADQLVEKVQWGVTNLAEGQARLVDTLRAQLAERDALLRDKSGDLIRMAAHLISAPLFALQDLKDEDKKMTRARVDHAVDVADARLKDAAYEIRRIADALSASAKPSAPVERDENADFEKWARSRITPLNLELDEIGLYHDLAAGTAHDAWQARAALEQKPS